MQKTKESRWDPLSIIYIITLQQQQVCSIKKQEQITNINRQTGKKI